jgi:hypothetical protein
VEASTSFGTTRHLTNNSDSQLHIALNTALTHIAQWRIESASPELPLLADAPTTSIVPLSVQNALRFVKEITADEWLGLETPAPSVNDNARPLEPRGTAQETLATAPIPLVAASSTGNLADILSAQLNLLSTREMDIVQGRIFDRPSETLDAIAARNSVTRERIRQIEGKLKGSIREWFSPGSALQVEADAVRGVIGPLISVDSLVDQMPGLATPVEPSGLPAWAVLERLHDELGSKGRWIAAPTVKVAEFKWVEALTSVTSEFGVLTQEDVTLAARDLSRLGDDDRAEWMVGLGYTSWQGYWVSPAVKSIPDRVAALLSVKGEPMSQSEIFSALPDKSQFSVKNALATDERVMRTDMTEWGLTKWGLDEYIGIRAEMERRVRSAGSIPLAQLIADLTTAFSVAPNSVVTYANAWPLVTREGAVSIDDDDGVVRRTIAQTKNLFRGASADEWVFRILVNSDHLRGSGFPVPLALAGAAGLVQGETRRMTTANGVVSFSRRGPQPQLGSIRTQLNAQNSKVGDHVILRGDTHSIEFENISPLPTSAVDALRRLLGLHSSGNLSLEEVLRSLELSAGSTWSGVRRVLQARGEEDLVQLLDDAAI